ncbi:MAG: ATP synthase F1 subunit epsilon [Alphaproteobacteria bacterium]|nr:ATP synthase F1 subunit epsilon [Alphaproteobacteria bacterium]
MAQLHFELVTPEKLLVSKPVAMVTVPGGDGEYGVLAGHAPMITSVRAGVIEICAEDDEKISERIFVEGGFAEVTPERCTILAEHVIPVGDLKKARLLEEAKALAEKIANAAEGDLPALQAQQALLDAKIQAVA